MAADPDVDAGSLRHLWLLKQRMLRHHVRKFFQQGVAAPLSMLLIGLVFSVGGLVLFFTGLKFLNGFPTVGPLIVERILILFFVTLMVMLTFSSTLVSFSTLYKAEESAYLWTLPLSPMAVFRSRAGEAVAMSSWAFLVLGGPMLVCWGYVQGAHPLFYAVLPAILVPFGLMCGLLGTFLTMLVAFVFPRLSWKTLGFLVAVCALGAGAYVLSAFAPWNVRGESSARVLNQMLAGLRNLQSPLVPSHWAFAGLSAAAAGQFARSLRFIALLWVNLLALELLLQVLVPRLLFPGYSALNRSSWARSKSFDSGVMAWLGRSLRFLDPIDRSMIIKDFRLFWRDPSQWSQFLLFTLLMLVYVGNVRHMPAGIRAPEWVNILQFLNFLACALLLATLTSRFIYPLVSLEGKTFWVVGLAPISRGRVLRQKLLLSLGTTLVFGEAMVLSSTLLLEMPPIRVLSFAALILLMNGTLACMAIGLAAIFPHFDEDNPSKIVNGVGGLMNFFLSIGYTVAVVLLIAAPAHLNLTGRLPDRSLPLAWAAATGAVLVLSLACAVLPLRFGLRKFRRLEL